jgi:hypothetical protein
MDNIQGMWDSITKQVSQFKYVWYLVTEHRRNVDIKLPCYNKINGINEIHFGK